MGWGGGGSVRVLTPIVCVVAFCGTITKLSETKKNSRWKGNVTFQKHSKNRILARGPQTMFVCASLFVAQHTVAIHLSLFPPPSFSLSLALSVLIPFQV